MPDNVLQIWPQIFSVVVGAIVLLAAALALGVRHRSRVGPGSKGHRPSQDEGESENVGPDGYIDSFADFVEEAGGSLPIMGWVIIGTTLIAYVTYLILFWQPR
jgi:hypothetical protein